MKWTDESLFEESRNIKQELILQENQTRRLIKIKQKYEKYIRFRKILVIGVKKR